MKEETSEGPPRESELGAEWRVGDEETKRGERVEFRGIGVGKGKFRHSALSQQSTTQLRLTALAPDPALIAVRHSDFPDKCTGICSRTWGGLI